VMRIEVIMSGRTLELEGAADAILLVIQRNGCC